MTLSLTPDFIGVTNGTVTVAKQVYENCSSFSILEVEGSGTYDETTGVIMLTLFQFFNDFGVPPTNIVLSTKQ